VQLAVLSSPPGACFGNISWSAITAGNDQSVLSGVLAGFVFAGIVAVLGVRAADHAKDAASALKLMFCAFIGLAVAAYLLADQAADTDCLRASAEETLAGGLLGTFAIIMIASLTWLMAAYNMHHHGVLQFLRRLLYVAAIFVVLLLCTSSYSYLQTDLRHGPSDAAVFWIYAVGALFYGIGHPVSVRTACFLAARAKRMLGLEPHGMMQKAESRRERRWAVGFCTWAALIYLTVAAIGDAYVISTNNDTWESPSRNLVYWVAWASLVLPLAVLMLAINALAPDAVAHDVKHVAIETPSRKAEASTTVSTQNSTSNAVPGRKHPNRPLYVFAGIAAACLAAYRLIHTSRRRSN
jgi:hypothetical protein